MSDYDILFGYKFKYCRNNKGRECAFYIRRSGKVEFKAFFTGEEFNPYKQVTFDIEPKAVEKLEALFANRSAVISGWAEKVVKAWYIEMQTVTFPGKTIDCYCLKHNRTKHNLDEWRRENPEYYNKYRNAMVQEDEMFELFEKINGILMEYGIRFDPCIIKIPEHSIDWSPKSF